MFRTLILFPLIDRFTVNVRRIISKCFNNSEAGIRSRDRLFLEVQEIVGMTTESLLTGRVLHGGVDPVDGHRPDAVLGVREVGADLK